MSRISGKTNICMIIGDPIDHSLSPAMHNAAYEALGIDNEFVFVAANVSLDCLKKAVEAMRVLGIRGMTCTMPHKIEVMRYLDEIDPIAKKIGAVNTIVNEKGTLKGYNTDWLGVLTPLERLTDLKEKKVAILGAGGAARAMICAVTSKGASFTIYNRTLSKAQDLAHEFNGIAKSLDNISEVKHADIILNATSLGMYPHVNETPLPKEYMTKNQIVFDAIYAPFQTRLLNEAAEQGAQIIYGLDMLLYQGIPQFELYTGKAPPEDIMRKVLMDNIE